MSSNSSVAISKPRLSPTVSVNDRFSFNPNSNMTPDNRQNVFGTKANTFVFAGQDGWIQTTQEAPQDEEESDNGGPDNEYQYQDVQVDIIGGEKSPMDINKSARKASLMEQEKKTSEFSQEEFKQSSIAVENVPLKCKNEFLRESIDKKQGNEQRVETCEAQEDDPEELLGTQKVYASLSEKKLDTFPQDH